MSFASRHKASIHILQFFLSFPLLLGPVLSLKHLCHFLQKIIFLFTNGSLSSSFSICLVRFSFPACGTWTVFCVPFHVRAICDSAFLSHPAVPDFLALQSFLHTHVFFSWRLGLLSANVWLMNILQYLLPAQVGGHQFSYFESVEAPWWCFAVGRVHCDQSRWLRAVEVWATRFQ